ncbi:iron complex outermembrane receptor protein/hemoglobin/transferrin/lactoferrin receptor protein [Tamilnaduibacter salinus]|uniref:Iron complex outermembrane receptor protein/hemoglobin/transferrin/lactoferrin receptor protein n=1 Tax=Tamilnaduibacter salinus TaxID=1484056 RepID=A0A2A2I1J8_9GAMM|nr:TonB-dependent receptor [Tamilnaduibacter salinus]PAV25527.1 TonB-dependent receptor [Tamilnaduibacter salinus]PVY77355.1 iron complex outermembrane receptor protein/hemoglobin/transferrin/lactoferrin receptor protein [Tamilnaduibacter salinus]
MRFKQAVPGRSLVLAGSVSLVVTAPMGWAQDEPVPSTQSLEEIVVEAGAPAPGSPLMQAAQVDVLQGAEKDRREATSLGNMLDDMPGVDTVSAGNQVGKPVIRGLSGNRVRVLSGGIGVDHQQFGTRHSPNIEPFLSDRIEVVRGAASLLYGSDAIGGAVNVAPLALEFSEDGERHSSGDALLGYATNNDQSDLGLKASSRGDRWTVAGGIIRRNADNLTVPDDPTFFPPPPSDPEKRRAPAYTGTLDYTDFDQLNGQVGVGYRAGFGEIRLRYTGWRNEQNFLLPPPAGNKPPSQGPEGVGQNLENDDIRLDARLPVDATWTVEPTLVWQNNLRQSNAAGTPRDQLFDGTIDIEFDQYTTRVEARHKQIGLLDGGRLGVAYRTRDQVSRGSTQLTPGGTVTNVGVFAFEESTIGRLTLQAGLRQDWTETVAKSSKTAAPTTFASEDENDYAVTTGSVGGAYAITDQLTLASNISRGFRAPTLFELHADGVHAGVAAVQQGNADLEAEKSLNTDLALRWRSERLSASATVYRNVIDHYIFLQDTGTTQNGLPVFSYQQTDAVLTGAELTATAQLTDTLELGTTYSTVNGENDRTGNDLPLQPADEVLVEGVWRPGHLGWLRSPYVRLGVRHNASKDAAPGEPFAQFDNAPFGTASTDAYTVADLGVGFGVGRRSGKPVRIDLSVRNLTDESYRDFLDTYKGYALSQGRNVSATLRVPLGG